MKPPSNEACHQALAILMASMREQNQDPDLARPDINLESLTFDTLEASGDAFHLAVEALRPAARFYAAPFYKQRNTLLPVHRLPFEIFGHILLKSLKNHGSSRVADLHQLAQVSAHWWAVIRQSALLWAYISLYDPQFDVALRKSQAAPIFLEIMPHLDSETQLQQFLDLVGTERYRWRSIDTDVMSRSGIQILELELPRLEYLSIFFKDPAFTPILPSLPQLQDLTIQGSSAQWAITPSFPALKSLNVSQSTMRSAAQVLDIIAASPLLENINFAEITYIEDPAIPTPALPEADLALPYLRNITLQSIPSDLPATILCYVRAERLLELDITGCHGSLFSVLSEPRDGSSLIQKLLRQFGVDFLSIFATPEDICVTGYRNDKRRDFPNPFHITINGLPDHISEFASSRLFDFQGAPPLDLYVYGSGCDIPEEFLAGIPSLRIMKYKFPIPIALVDYLSQPLPGGVSWPCPLLTSLSSPLDPRYGISARKELIAALARLVNVRRAQDLGGDGEAATRPTVQRPAALYFNDQYGSVLDAASGEMVASRD